MEPMLSKDTHMRHVEYLLTCSLSLMDGLLWKRFSIILYYSRSIFFFTIEGFIFAVAHFEVSRQSKGVPSLPLHRTIF